MSLHPILKASWISQLDPNSTTPALPFARCQLRNPLFSPHVHFPATPVLSSSESTHSATAYDRAPIDVSPNACQLPERGGRVYTPVSPKRSYFHPRAFEACEAEPLEEDDDDDDLTYESQTQLACPALVSDMSSATESSDDLDSPTPLSSSINPYFSFSFSSGASHSPFARTSSQEEFDRALLFLPHPPTPGKPPPGRRKKHHPHLSSSSSVKTEQALADTFTTSPPILTSDSDSCLDGF